MTAAEALAPCAAAIWALDVWAALEWGWTGTALPVEVALVAESHPLGGQGQAVGLIPWPGLSRPHSGGSQVEFKRK